jgi:hypothetical protein
MAISYNKKKLILRSHLLIFQELANNPSKAEIKIKRSLALRDRTLKLKENPDKEQIGKYLDKILAQAKSLNKPNISKKIP